MTDSLIVAEAIELIGQPGGIPSTDPRCPGARFRLLPGFDLSAPQPTTDIVASLLLDGERPFGYRASNRTIVLPILINAPDFYTLAAAREVLLQAIDAQRWTLRWTRDTAGPYAGQSQAMPLLFDCFRAQPTVVQWGGVDKFNLHPYGLLTITFPALPYARSDVPQLVPFTSPLSGQTPPASPVTVDNFSTVPDNFLQGAASTFEGSLSGWVAAGSCTVADSAAQAHTGSDSMAMTATASASMQARAGSVFSSVNAMPVTRGQPVTVSAWFRANTTVRSCQTTVRWYNAAGGVVSDSFGSAANDSNAAWTQVTGNFLAPAGAAFALPGVQVISPVSTEVHYVDDVILDLANWTQSTVGPGPHSAHWNPAPAPASNPTGTGLPATYSNWGPLGLNLTGLTALTFWAGFGSTSYFPHWGRAGGPVTFAVTLTDNTGAVLSFARTIKVIKGSNSSATPLWTKVRVGIPQLTAAALAFNFTNLASYTLTVTNHAGDLRYTDFYIDSLTAVPPPTQNTVAPNRGWVYDLAGIVGTARGTASWQFQQAGTAVTVTQVFNTPGSFMWVAPPSVSTVAVFNVGGGGAGASTLNPANFGGGGGGAGSAANAAVAVTALTAYPYTVGSPGDPTVTTDGTASVFAGDAATVTANGGHSGLGVSAGAGGAAGTGGHAGAIGGVGSSPGGGGGGSSGGTANNGNLGTSGAGGGAGGAAVTGGGAGGRGGTVSRSKQDGFEPGGGGGGSCALAGGHHTGGYGAAGWVSLTFTGPPTFQTLVAHRPNPQAPDTLCPFIQLDPVDVPDGTTVYPVQSLIPSLNARFDGTYTVIITNNSWASPSSSRTITVTITEWEQQGGASYPTSVSLPVIPNNLTSDFVTLGVVTLPVKALPPDNYDSFFTVTVTDTNTSDTFLDILFLDTMGSTVIVEAATPYQNMWIDEPTPTRDLGLVLASIFDRGDAVSVLDVASVSGPGLFVDPENNQTLLVYCIEGAPNAYLTYYPRWWMDRFA